MVNIKIIIIPTIIIIIFIIDFFRSGVRLISLGSGHTPLKLVISEQSSTRQRYKDLLNTQIASSQRLERWSQAEENPALQDIMHQVHELNMMWVDAQREFVGRNDYVRLGEGDKCAYDYT